MIGCRVAACAVLCAVTAGTPSALAQTPAGTPEGVPAPSVMPPAPAPKPGSTAGAPAPEPGDEVVVVLKDGRRFVGVLEPAKAGEGVPIRIAGVRTRFTQDEVERVEKKEQVLERYRRIRAAIDDEDAEQLFRLAQWLVANRELEAAGIELAATLKADPSHAGAIRLRDLVEKQLALKERRAAETPGEDGRDADAGGPEADEAPEGARRRDTFPLLTPEQINLLKVYESNLSRPPQLVVRRETVLQMLRENAGHPLVPASPEGQEALLRRSPAELLDLMFKLRARNLYGQVQVLDHPESMRLFRQDVWRSWLANSCATTACHGGAEAGRLQLASDRPNADATVYTNFLILDRFRMADGQPLLNTSNPERSPLLHLGLARHQSLTPHPRVPSREGTGRDQWRPVFRSVDERRFEDTVRWVRSLTEPRPDYPIEYVAPGWSTPPEDGTQPDGR